MDTRTTGLETQHPYSSNPWASSGDKSASTVTTPSSLATPQEDSPLDVASLSASASTSSPSSATSPFPSHLDLIPLIFPQQSIYHAMSAVRIMLPLPREIPLDVLVDKYNVFIFEVVKAHVAKSPKHPETLHYTGDGVFMVSGKIIHRKSQFRPGML